MMRSLSSAVAGLRSHQTKMDVIGNNIANVNTYGFKSSRTTFSDVYYQTLSSGSGPSGTRGGTNPTQIGYGSSVATIDVMMDVSAAASTDRPLDVFLTGDGFLVSMDSRGNYTFTRLGNLGFDEDGMLVDFSGNPIMGFPTDRNTGEPLIGADGTATGGLDTIHVGRDLLDQLTGISISANGKIIGVLEGGTKVTLSAGAPTWATGMDIADDSNINGNIRLRVRAEFGNIAGNFPAGYQPTNATLSNYNEALCLDDELEIELDSSGNITITGQYVNESGKLTPFTATKQLDGTANAQTLTFTHNGKNLFDLTISGLDNTQWPPQVASYRGTETTTKRSYTGDATNPTDITAQIANALNAAGMTGFDTSTLEVIIPAGITSIEDLEFEVNHQAGTLKLVGGTYNGGTTIPPVTINLGTITNGAIPIVGPVNIVDGGTTVFSIEIKAAGASFAQPSMRDDSVKGTTAFGDFFYNATWNDKGDNVHYAPNDDDATQWARLTGNQIALGDAILYLDTQNNPVEAFNGAIGKAQPDENEYLTLGCIALAIFRNPQALSQEGNSLYMETANSGEPKFVMPGSNGSGGLKGGYLEMSNVDISKEFTDMITTQRGFQANTRIITVSDEMLQELVNLKR